MRIGEHIDCQKLKKNHTPFKNADMKIRKNTTIGKNILERADAVMKARGFDDFSEFISALIREEYERRHPPVLTPSNKGRHRLEQESAHTEEDEGGYDVNKKPSSPGEKAAEKALEDDFQKHGKGKSGAGGHNPPTGATS